MAVSAVVFFASYFYFALSSGPRSFIYISPFLLFYFLLFTRKTLKEKEIMEEPESLLGNPLIAVYTISLLLLLALAFFLD
jgi:hypothetical protein